jgi:hypothetical protein
MLMLSRRSTATAALMATVTMVVTGCAQGGLTQQYGDTSDRCYTERKPLLDTEGNYAQPMITGAVIGGALGGAAGGLAGRSWESALIGLGTGIVAGAGVGYLSERQRMAHSQQELLASIDADARRDVQGIRTSTSAIANLTRCRNAEIAVVNQRYAAKATTAQQARAEYQQIDQRMKGDDELINKVLGQAGDRARTYVQARAKTLNVPEQAVYTPAPPSASPGAQPPRTRSSTTSQTTVAAPPPRSDTEAFARGTEEAKLRADEHKQARDDLENRIKDLSVISG